MKTKILSLELDDSAAAQLAERADDCARIRQKREVIRCAKCRRKMYRRLDGLCPWCNEPLWCNKPLMSVPLPKPSVPERSGELGAAIRAVRKAAGLRSIKLAALIGFSPVNISRWEHGTIIPSWEAAEKTAAVFGLEVLDLIQGPKHAETVFWFGKLTPKEQAEVCGKIRRMTNGKMQSLP